MDKEKPKKHSYQRGMVNIQKRNKVWELKSEHRAVLKTDPDLARIMKDLHQTYTENPPLDFEHKWTRLHLEYEPKVQGYLDALKKEYQDILTQRYADFIEKV